MPFPASELMLGNASSFDAWLAEIERRNGERGLLSLLAAAQWASSRHGGFFRSPRLEGALAERHALGPPPRSAPRGRPLMVLTQAYGTGGHTRLAMRWLAAATRSYDLVITSAGGWHLPAPLRARVTERGGLVMNLDDFDASLTARARTLRSLVSRAPLVVLLTHPWDVITQLALEDSATPALWVSHTDHSFSLIPNRLAAVAELRQCNLELSQQRRALGHVPGLVVPVPLDVPRRELSREAARRQLEVGASQRLIVTVAPPHRYRPWETVDYLHLARRILEADPAAVLHAVGADDSEAWRALAREHGGRLRACGLQLSLAPWHAAADVFLECVPWGSFTAALEFALLGVPVVTFRPLAADAVLSADAPSSYGVLTPENAHTMNRLLDEVLGRPDTAAAAALAENLRETQTGEGWRARALHAEEFALNTGNVDARGGPVAPPGEWDRALAQIHELGAAGETPADMYRAHIVNAGLALRVTAAARREAPLRVMLPNRVLRLLLATRARLRA